ncbi:cation:proton antiporter [Segnochrobactraceae bacterium EtOH-i3]
MPHDIALIATIAVGFVLAFVFGYAAIRLRLPPLVGYLVAGILVGPFTPGFVADGGLSSQLAEIGVILLMFGVGLHFSPADLIAVKAVAIPGAIVQIIIATLLAMGLTHFWGWSLGAGLIFGLSLSVASTVVLLKALEERNLLETPSGRVAVGWLIVEDLAMVLALVLVPALAGVLGGTPLDGGGHGGGHGADDGPVLLTLAITLGKVALFAVLAIVAGPKVVPWILKQVARTGSRELFTLCVLAIAMGIAFGAAEIFGVSFALGAFFAGVVMNESHFSHRAAKESLPLQDAFAVLFFVSVGMLFDPMILVTKPLAVLAVLALVIFGKGLIAYGIVRVLRYPAAMGLTIAASLAQVGEFSFILIGLGRSLDLLPKEGADLILAAALFSITLNPVSFLLANLLRGRLPASVSGAENLARLETSLEEIREKVRAREEAHTRTLDELPETFPVLAHLSPDQREDLLLLFRPKSAGPGDKVIRKGDRPDGMYFLARGTVEVSTPGGPVRLEAGSFFGEMALLDGSRRTATITAVDYCQFQVLGTRDFNQFIARFPILRQRLDIVARQRQQANAAAGSSEVATAG